MDAFEVTLWIVGAIVVSAPFAIWHYGLAGLRFGFAGVAIFAVATLWQLASDSKNGVAMVAVWLTAFSYVGAFALIAHAAGHLNRGSTQ
jgi:hypothetical protein